MASFVILGRDGRPLGFLEDTHPSAAPPEAVPITDEQLAALQADPDGRVFRAGQVAERPRPNPQLAGSGAARARRQFRKQLAQDPLAALVAKETRR